eukprot:TRINITY_DN12062_c0_g1_i1.p1 TRINITY_DN12062_c0_g1~~TRINITY_DN12062_c0_g1_i1.p1  ORF type:complete len:409 (+),score=98.08 TRINITY_DN12062_c0_g1_i1:64-1290(+)
MSLARDYDESLQRDIVDVLDYIVGHPHVGVFVKFKGICLENIGRFREITKGVEVKLTSLRSRSETKALWFLIDYLVCELPHLFQREFSQQLPELVRTYMPWGEEDVRGGWGDSTCERLVESWRDRQLFSGDVLASIETAARDGRRLRAERKQHELLQQQQRLQRRSSSLTPPAASPPPTHHLTQHTQPAATTEHEPASLDAPPLPVPAPEPALELPTLPSFTKGTASPSPPPVPVLPTEAALPAEDSDDSDEYDPDAVDDVQLDAQLALAKKMDQEYATAEAGEEAAPPPVPAAPAPTGPPGAYPYPPSARYQPYGDSSPSRTPPPYDDPGQGWPAAQRSEPIWPGGPGPGRYTPPPYGMPPQQRPGHAPPPMPGAQPAAPPVPAIPIVAKPPAPPPAEVPEDEEEFF